MIRKGIIQLSDHSTPETLMRGGVQKLKRKKSENSSHGGATRSISARLVDSARPVLCLTFPCGCEPCEEGSGTL